MDLLEETEPSLVRKTSTISSLLILVGFVLLGLFLGQFAAIIGILPLVDYNFQNFQQVLADPTGSPQAKTILLIIQAATSIFGFIIAPLLHQQLIDQKRPSALTARYETSLIILGLVFLLMIAFMFANSVVIEWNMNLDFSQQEITDIDMEATEVVAWPIALGATVAGAFLLYQFRQMTKPKQPYG